MNLLANGLSPDIQLLFSWFVFAFFRTFKAQCATFEWVELCYIERKMFNSVFFVLKKAKQKCQLLFLSANHKLFSQSAGFLLFF